MSQIITDAAEISRLLGPSRKLDESCRIIFEGQGFPLVEIMNTGNQSTIVLKLKSGGRPLIHPEQEVEVWIGQCYFKVKILNQVHYTVIIYYPDKVIVEMTEPVPETPSPPTPRYIAPVRPWREKDPSDSPNRWQNDDTGVWVMSLLFIAAVAFYLVGLPWLEAKFF